MNKTQQNKIAQEEDQVEQQQQSTGIPETSKTVVVMDFLLPRQIRHRR